MERIKQAIDKVKKQHPNSSKQLVQPESSVRNTSTAISAQAHHALENISYTQTIIFKLNHGHLEKNRIVSFDKNNATSMHFDLLRTLVLQKMEEKGWRTLAITSPNPEAGKTVVSINLAMSIAQQTSKTAMLVDFDLRRPKVGAYLGLPMEKSLNNLLDGTAEIPDILVNPDMPRLVVLPTRTPVKRASETLSSQKISALIKELRERYESRIVIFDLPPVLVTDDAIALIPQIDCFLMVVANGMSTRREIEASLRLLPTENLVGTILNKADIEPSAYYY